MICPNCNATDHESGAVYCHKCGSLLVSNNSSSRERPKQENHYNLSPAPVGVEAVDLGLPSGTKWANMNVGATKPEEFGGYYAWGETEMKDDYSWESYIHGDFSHCSDIGNLCGTIYDAARLKWGKPWKMPSRDQFQELLDNCKCIPSRLNGIRGITLQGNNGNYIFLPRAGYKSGRELVKWENGLDCFYWSGTQSGFAAHEMDYTYGFADMGVSPRYCGLTVRPVQ